MTSVRNHRPPLSGNKWLFFIALFTKSAACTHYWPRMFTKILPLGLRPVQATWHQPGANFKLQIFDSKDDAAQAHSLVYNPADKKW
jgi:hypothetical protein